MSANSLPFFPKRQLALTGPPLPICQQQLHHVGTAIPPPYMNRLRLGRDKGCVPLGTGAGAGSETRALTGQEKVISGPPVIFRYGRYPSVEDRGSPENLDSKLC